MSDIIEPMATLPGAGQQNLVDTDLGAWGPDVELLPGETITSIGRWNQTHLYRVTRGGECFEPVPEVLLQSALDKLREGE